ncbi:MAG TPA: tetratricopeptide repeat protein [Gammaproteobacteria bacterium]|jgi:tetratricopeptide (TPR) repeat protein
MISFDVRQVPRVAAVIAWLAVTVVPLAAVSQPPFEPVARDEQERQIIDQLQRIEAEDGPNSPDSIDLWKALGLLYQESGDDALAGAATERALQIVRMSYGVYSLEQAPLIQQLIRADEASGNYAGAWEREQELLTLMRRHPDDMRTVPVLREIGAGRLDVVDRYLAGERPPQIALGCYYDWSRSDTAGNCQSGSRRDAVRALVYDAQRNYADAIAVILRNELYSSEELRELEQELARSSDLIRYYNEIDPLDPDLDLFLPPPVVRNKEPWRSTVDALLLLADWDLPDSPGAALVERGWLEGREAEVFRTDDADNPYRLGRLALQRMFDYVTETSASGLNQVDAIVALADWDLLYSRNALALEEYALAYGLLEETAEGQASIERIFLAQKPVMLPAFSPNPLVVDETAEATGYIDFSFEITKYGESRRIEIVDATTSATDADKTRAIRRISRNRFRPRVMDARAVAAPPVVARYYLYE